MKNLKKILKDEVSSQKCLEKIEISSGEKMDFRIFEKINFFKFHVILTTGTSKLSENQYLEKVSDKS